jgi:hypothetical protein
MTSGSATAGGKAAAARTGTLPAQARAAAPPASVPKKARLRIMTVNSEQVTDTHAIFEDIRYLAADRGWISADLPLLRNDDKIGEPACASGDSWEALMISSHTTRVAERAKAIYAERLQSDLEAAHPSGYVAIEPESGEHFLADSFGGAVAAARTAYPDRISFVIHIGHSAAIHLGGLTT